MKIKINKYYCQTVQVAFIIAIALAPNLHTLLTCFLLNNSEEHYFSHMVRQSGVYPVIYLGLQFALYCLKMVMMAALASLTFSEDKKALN